MNGVNLNHFQFEYELTWMSFFQNAEGRTYTRYGGREDYNSESHLNKASLVKVMKQVLELHKKGAVQPANRFEPIANSVSTAEDIPTLKGMFAKRKESCIHCHDVQGARLLHLADQGKLRKDMIYTYPPPSRLGLHLDPLSQTNVSVVDPGSPAAAAGIKKGDTIKTVAKQRVLTLGDFSRVLELAPGTGSVPLELTRDGKTISTKIKLKKGWQIGKDASWRQSTGLLGPSSGFWGREVNNEDKKRFGIKKEGLAIRINFIWGQWTKDAGIKHGDVVISIDGQNGDMTIRQLQAYLHLNRNWGDKINLTVIRGGKPRKLTMNLPKERPH